MLCNMFLYVVQHIFGLLQQDALRDAFRTFCIFCKLNQANFALSAYSCRMVPK